MSIARFRAMAPGELRGRCWCDTTFVGVSPEEVRAGLTRPCRAAACRAMDAAARNISPEKPSDQGVQRRVEVDRRTLTG